MRAAPRARAAKVNFVAGVDIEDSIRGEERVRGVGVTG